MTHEELLLTPEYYTTLIQVELYNRVEDYLKKNKITRTELAKQLGVSKGYISQVLNGNFDHRMSKFVELSLAIGCKPQIVFETAQENNVENYDNIERIILETRKSLQSIGYCSMIYKVQYGNSNLKNNEPEQKLTA